METTTLPDGSLKHTLEGWIGIQNPNQSIIKTKWRRTDTQYWTINGYTVTRDNEGKMTCQCKGYKFRKHCRHITEAKNG
tara:strand:- start:411 stop:647 length:237 start_codon:yes stop_codon:yes gene_type:complete